MSPFYAIEGVSSASPVDYGRAHHLGSKCAAHGPDPMFCST